MWKNLNYIDLNKSYVYVRYIYWPDQLYAEKLICFPPSLLLVLDFSSDCLCWLSSAFRLEKILDCRRGLVKGGGGAVGLAYCLGDYALRIVEQQQQQSVQRRMLHLWLINVPAIWDDDDDDNVDDHDDEEEDDDDDEDDDVGHYEQLVGWSEWQISATASWCWRFDSSSGCKIRRW